MSTWHTHTHTDTRTLVHTCAAHHWASLDCRKQEARHVATERKMCQRLPRLDWHCHKMPPTHTHTYTGKNAHDCDSTASYPSLPLPSPPAREVGLKNELHFIVGILSCGCRCRCRHVLCFKLLSSRRPHLPSRRRISTSNVLPLVCAPTPSPFHFPHPLQQRTLTAYFRLPQVAATCNLSAEIDHKAQFVYPLNKAKKACWTVQRVREKEKVKN